MINTHWLRTFCSLVEVGHFTRTAEKLHMTQSGVSQQVKKLEAQIGADLLIREGKQFTLTDAGEKLYISGQEILLNLENLAKKVKTDDPYEGDVKIMSPGSVGLKLYPHLLALQHIHPKLIIDYRFGANSDVENAILNGKVDIGLVTSPSSHLDLSCVPIAKEALLLITPTDVLNPSWEALAKLGFINHPDGSHHANLLLSANYSEYEHSDLLLKKGFSNQIGLILEPVSLGLGFTVLPAYAVEAFYKQDLIKVHRLKNPISETLYLCLARNKVRPNRMQTIIDEIKRWL